MNLQKHIDFIIDAHQNYPKKPSNALRYWDMKTPYSIHPIWCAITLLTETELEEKLRNEGCLALLYHDVLEDTTCLLPNNLSSKVKNMIEDMTYYGGIEEEMEKVWSKDKEIILLKLYDKTSTLLDSVWMNKDELSSYKKYTRKLNTFVKKEFGNLNIVKIADSLL